MSDFDRIAAYAYRYWMRHGMTEWPTVRQTANATRIRQSVIHDYAGAGDYDLTAKYDWDTDPPGDFYVEAETPDVEREWCAYWLPYSHTCTCGQHGSGAPTH